MKIDLSKNLSFLAFLWYTEYINRDFRLGRKVGKQEFPIGLKDAASASEKR